MKSMLKLLAGAIIAAAVSLPIQAQSDATHMRLGAEKQTREFYRIELKNFQDEDLGRITDLGIDLVNGRIVEALVDCDSSLGVGNKIIAVPPLAMVPDLINRVYRLDVSTETFKNAPGIDLSKWTDAGRSDRVAAAYRLFGQEPYFLLEGETAPKGETRPKVALGYVERLSKVIDLPVGNMQDQKLGKVWSMTLSVTRGRILSVIVLAPGNFKTKSVIPAMALSFNSDRSALLLDDSKLEFADEPRYVFTDPAFGQKGDSQEESYQGPHTSVPLEQGTSYRDVDQTVRINKDIRLSKINGRHVQVGTLNDRVTLRGWVVSEEDRRRIGEIAISASRLELVDNQITVKN